MHFKSEENHHSICQALPLIIRPKVGVWVTDRRRLGLGQDPGQARVKTKIRVCRQTRIRIVARVQELARGRSWVVILQKQAKLVPKPGSRYMKKVPTR